MAEVDPKRVKDVRIKTGVVKRLAKEKSAYQQEAVKQQERIDKMKADGKDEYDIRKQEEVLQESNMMIPDVERRLGAAWEELSKLMETEKDLAETKEYQEAQEILANSKEAARK